MAKMNKEKALEHWAKLPVNVNPLQYMEAIPYKTTGSRYGTCGIRIDGTPEFIDAVLGKLKDLIPGEGVNTRLELARNEVKPVTIQGETKAFDNSCDNAEVCYIRLHERGSEGAMLQQMIKNMTEKSNRRKAG